MLALFRVGSAAACAVVLAACQSVTSPPAATVPASVAPTAGVTPPAGAAGCPASPYGARSYAPGGTKTVALTFDDGPGKSTAAILAMT